MNKIKLAIDRAKRGRDQRRLQDLEDELGTLDLERIQIIKGLNKSKLKKRK